jgi:hypothetical protein
MTDDGFDFIHSHHHNNILFHHPPYTMAVAAAETNGASIEAFFRPSTRYRDSHPNHLPEGCTEVELLPGQSLENIRSTRLPWDAFNSFARQKLVWMTPNVYVCNKIFFWWTGGSLSWSGLLLFQPVCPCNAGCG